MSEKEIEVYGKQVDEIKIRPYEHHAKYYETDQMGIIHHSNYIKWMEEARMDLMAVADHADDRRTDCRGLHLPESAALPLWCHWYGQPERVCPAIPAE